MSLAYIDSTSGFEKKIEFCKNTPKPFNAHMGFINLCTSCYTHHYWQYQKAAKPQSGVIGKLSSEIILKFISCLHDFSKVEVLGGTGLADAKLECSNGITIFAEVKSAPLITFPLLFNINIGLFKNHVKPELTHSQVKILETGLQIFDCVIPLGQVQDALWPFKPTIDFLLESKNTKVIDELALKWLLVKNTYIKKNKENFYYYLTNACGQPPAIAKSKHDWPAKEVISDSKTTVGMDRTDDIKKALYQTLKIGSQCMNKSVKTAIISNLPAMRHKEDYIDPIKPILWGHESKLQEIAGIDVISREDLRYIVDYLITLEEPLPKD